ncbi:MAG: GIY-YIG nuclease family protein [Candidatus Pacebacteria bacterium]|nr:GIY-YIG nuclease family protein [Candidatus Paceibacterota bacterium]
MVYTVYILRCSDNSLYCGITTDVERRFREHQAGKGGNYTRSHKVLKIVYTEKKKNRSMASKREAEIKKLSKQQKLLLIRNVSKK